MAAQPVEWMLIIFYGTSAHRATYGRLGGTKYTKDYVQLSRKKDFIDSITSVFPIAGGSEESVPLTYAWPLGTASGQLIRFSADRPHLSWETRSGAPPPWKMALVPSEATAETIPGNPGHLDPADAEGELELLANRGVGQPYLVAIKLQNEANTLHLRAYLAEPSEQYAWASTQLLPREVQALAAKTSQGSALAWSTFQSGGEPPSERVNEVLARLIGTDDPKSVIDTLEPDTGRALATYLQRPAHGLFFDPMRNHDAWLETIPLSVRVTASLPDILHVLEERFPVAAQGDAVAEMLEVSIDEVEAFREQIERQNYEVPDSRATVKTRGSAQRAFADAVKRNYGSRCAVTDISTKAFLVAAHIVPWSEDQTIRLDPSNGICFSLLIDRAFEKGYLLIGDDLTIAVNWDKIGSDAALKSQLEPYDGQTLRAPEDGAPSSTYLARCRQLVG